MPDLKRGEIEADPTVASIDRNGIARHWRDENGNPAEISENGDGSYVIIANNETRGWFTDLDSLKSHLSERGWVPENDYTPNKYWIAKNPRGDAINGRKLRTKRNWPQRMVSVSWSRFHYDEWQNAFIRRLPDVVDVWTSTLALVLDDDDMENFEAGNEVFFPVLTEKGNYFVGVKLND